MLFLKDQEAEAEEGEEVKERLIDGSRRNGFEGNVVWLEAILKKVPRPLGDFGCRRTRLHSPQIKLLCRAIYIYIYIYLYVYVMSILFPPPSDQACLAAL